MVTLDKIRKPIGADLDAFDEFVVRNFTAEGELLSDMLRYALSARGKGIRPTVVLLAAGLNAPVRRERMGQRAYLAALLVEMIHVASLIHDDVIDGADMRRGRPSVNALWQSRNAVVLGDYILARTMSTGMASAQYDLVSHIIGSVATLCEGEVLQSQHARDKDTTRRDYLEIIYKKTASLISISASAGAVSVIAPHEDIERMRRFGEALGMAFQIKDDILDYSRSNRTGKPANNDLREGKITLPLIEVLERCEPAEKLRLMDSLSRCGEDPAAVDYIHSAVEDAGGIEMAERAMRTYIDRAVEILSHYDESPYRTALVNLCAYVAERDR